MKSFNWYAWVNVVAIVMCGFTAGCAAFTETIYGALLPKKQPAPVQINYRGCRSSEQCAGNMEFVRAMKGDCNAFPNYDCSQYDPIIAHLDGQRRELLAREQAEQARIDALRKEEQLRRDEFARQENEKREKRERDIQERIERAQETRRLARECDEKRMSAKHTCDAWINTNCKPVLVSRVGCQQFTERTWGRVTTWTECVDTYKAQCTKPDTAPSLCKPEAANGEVFSNAYIDQCSITSDDIRQMH